MKKLLLTIILLLSLKTGFSQYYNFTQLNETYADLTGSTIISQPGWDDSYIDTVPFPFQFNFFGANFDTFYVNGGYGGFEYYGQGNFGNYEILYYDAPLWDLGFGLSPVSYSVSGATPNRILKLEIKNAGFSTDLTNSDYVDFQVWFFETTNVVEIHNGPNSVSNSGSWYSGYQGPGISLVRDTTTFIQLYGNASAASSSTTYVSDYVTGAPPVTSVYRFTPLFSGIPSIKQLPVSVFPNPSNGLFTINTSSLNASCDVSIYSMEGNIVFHETLEPGFRHLDYDVSAGVYILKMISTEGQYIQRLIITR